MRLFLLSLLALFPLLLTAQKPTTQPVPKGQKYTNTEHHIEWTLLDDKNWTLRKNPQTSVLAIILHNDEQGGAHPSVMLSFDKLPKEVSTVKDYADMNVVALKKYGFTDVTQKEITFAGQSAIEVQALTEGEKKVMQQVYLVRGAVGYVVTTTCPASMFERYQKLLKQTRETLVFVE